MTRAMRHVRHAFMAMGSPCELQLCAADGQVDAAIGAVLAEIERLEQLYSTYRESSFISEINRAAARGGSIVVDSETAGLLDYADACFRESGGLFDITSGVLRRAWDFKSGTLPDRAKVETLLEVVGWNKVRWQPPVLDFSVVGMELDLGGVVKEYAADRAAAVCRAMNVQGGLVNLGGDICIIGPHPTGDAWHIGLQHPRMQDRVLGVVQLAHGGLATSGDYERCIIVDDIHYTHILNPLSGWPVRHLASVTVIADRCVVAGSASTIAMLKEEAGPQWLSELALPHLWVDWNGQIGGSLLDARDDNESA